jgi:hypothetical protein
MIAESRYEELERRVSTAESEIEGEKQVSRYAIEQSRRSTEAFMALRTEVAALRADVAMVIGRVDFLAGEAAVMRATLIHHGRALDVLQQDVSALRNDTIAMRQDMATRQELAAARDELRSEMATMRDELRSEMTTMRDELRSEMTTMRDELRSEMTTMREEAAMRHAELLAAIRTPAQWWGAVCVTQVRSPGPAMQPGFFVGLNFSASSFIHGSPVGHVRGLKRSWNRPCHRSIMRPARGSS